MKNARSKDLSWLESEARNRWIKGFIAVAATLSIFLVTPMLGLAQTDRQGTDMGAEGKYAKVNGLNMYYEVHGAGEPIVILHGAYMTIEMMGAMISELAKTRQVIAVELQGHGHTADSDRPLSYEALADDVAALLEHLTIEKADIFGYSMGGGVALQVAIRHPEVVRKLIVTSMYYDNDGTYPEMFEGIEQITPEAFAGSPMEQAYLEVAPNSDDFPKLIAKLKELDLTFTGFPSEDIASIKAPTLLIIGDSDVIRPEHAVEMFRLLGGGVPGDFIGLPNAQLAVLPGTTHVTLMMTRTDWLLSMMTAFLDMPLPEVQ